MALLQFNSCCCIFDLNPDNIAVLGVFILLYKLFHLAEIAWMLVLGMAMIAFSGIPHPQTQALMIMTLIIGVVTFVEIVLLIFLTSRVPDNFNGLYIANAIFFAVECIALTIFVGLLAFEPNVESPKTKFWTSVWVVVPFVVNFYFILLLRSFITRERGLLGGTISNC